MVPVPAAARSDPPGPFTVGFIGHWLAKGGPTVIEAHRRLRSEGHDCELVIVGSEPQLTAEQSCELGVHWLERKSHEALVNEVIPRFSAFAYPTHFDGLPMTLLEVMAAGVPVVVSDYRALPEVVDYGRAGAVVPEGDAIRLADALRKLLDPAARQLQADAARRRVECRYSAAATGPLLERVYRAALG
jgi:glycosyltransferase involved in cell wall biosynthesis